MTVLADMVKKLVRREIEGFTSEDYRKALEEIVNGEMPEALTAAFLTAQALLPIQAPALVGAVQVLRSHVLPVGLPEGLQRELVDTCGTGGDGQNTFNISTTAAFVAAGAGVNIAKHGNRSASSQSGSADCLEQMGVPLDLKADISLQTSHFAFLYAPLYHNAMKRVSRIREVLGFRTLFNLVAPLANPAHAPFQVLGVFDRALQEPLAKALQQLGTRKAWVVHGDDGLDEITLTTKTHLIEVTQKTLHESDLNPLDYGFKYCKKDDLRGGTAKQNAAIAEQILKGEKGPKADCVLLNAAAAILVAGKAADFAGALTAARQSIETGAALDCLQKLRSLKRTPSS